MRALRFPFSTTGYQMNAAFNAAASEFKAEVHRIFGMPYSRDTYETHWKEINQYYLMNGDILWVPKDEGNELWMLLNAPPEATLVTVNPAMPWRWTADNVPIAGATGL